MIQTPSARISTGGSNAAAKMATGEMAFHAPSALLAPQIFVMGMDVMNVVRIGISFSIKIIVINVLNDAQKLVVNFLDAKLITYMY